MHILHFPFFFCTKRTGKDHGEWDGSISPFFSKDTISFFNISECSLDILYGFNFIGLFVSVIIECGSSFAVDNWESDVAIQLLLFNIKFLNSVFISSGTLLIISSKVLLNSFSSSSVIITALISGVLLPLSFIISTIFC